MVPTVYSLQSMPLTSLTASDVPPPPCIEPLPTHLTSSQKAPPGVAPSPLGASFLCHDNAEWEANSFIVTCFFDAESTVPVKVNLFDFVNETPDKHFQQRIEQDKRYYLPPTWSRLEKKQIQKMVRTFTCLPTFPVVSTTIRALMRDIRSFPMGARAGGQ